MKLVPPESRRVTSGSSSTASVSGTHTLLECVTAGAAAQGGWGCRSVPPGAAPGECWWSMAERPCFPGSYGKSLVPKYSDLKELWDEGVGRTEFVTSDLTRLCAGGVGADSEHCSPWEWTPVRVLACRAARSSHYLELDQPNFS